MGVKHHYQQHSNYVISRQVSLNDGENWSTLTSFKLTKLYHMMYTVSIDKVMIQILVILKICHHRFPQVHVIHVIFTLGEKTPKYMHRNLFFFYPL
jgi:hypothetical protein